MYDSTAGKCGGKRGDADDEKVADAVLNYISGKKNQEKLSEGEGKKQMDGTQGAQAFVLDFQPELDQDNLALMEG